MPALLFRRSLLDDDDSSDDGHQCRSFGEDNQAAPVVGDLTLHELMKYISGGTTAVCCLVAFLIVLGHICNYRVRRVQKQYIRLILVPPVFALINMGAVFSYRANPYLEPLTSIYEAFAMVALLFLYIAYLVPEPSLNAEYQYFSHSERLGIAAFSKIYYSVVQTLPVQTVCIIAMEIVTAVHCHESKAYKRAHTVLSVIKSASVAIAIVSLLRMYKRTNAALKQADPKIMGKMANFKGIVFLHFVQQLIFSILTNVGALSSSHTASYNDLNLGLLPLLICCEAMLIVLFMIYTFWPGQLKRYAPVPTDPPAYHAESDGSTATELKYYTGSNIGQATSPKLGFVRALLDAIDFRDVLSGMARAVKLFARNHSSQGHAQMTAARGQWKLQQRGQGGYQQRY